MATQSMLRGVLLVLQKAGIYDVVLPFILIFAILFAILERTHVLGKDKDNNTKKSLNTLVAFVIAFLVVASTELVRVLNESIANVSILFIVIVLFLMMVGLFVGGDVSWAEKYPGWTKFFLFASFIGIVLIFINSLGWISIGLEALAGFNISLDQDLLFGAIAVGVAGLIIWLIIKDDKPKDKK